MTKYTRAVISSAVDKVVRMVHPEKIILFGSHAYGRPTKDSDVDILVVQKTRLPFAERIRRVSSAVGTHFLPMDFMVLTPREIQRRRAGFDPFLEEVLSGGRLLYARSG
jgi:predicted nucleotidyltransferase